MSVSSFELRVSSRAQPSAAAISNPKLETRNSKLATAFTLVELVVVMVIIAVLSTLALPSMVGQRASADLRAAARSLHVMARHGQERAIARSITCRLMLAQDTERSAFRLEREDPEQPGYWVAMPDALVGPVSLPAGVAFASVIIEPVRRDPTAERAIYFYPDGGADAAVVQLTNGKTTWSVLVEPNTGRVDLADFAVNVSPNRREDLD